MKPNYFFVVLLVLLSNLSTFSQNADEMERKAEAIILNLAHHGILTREDFDELKSLVLMGIRKEVLEEEYHSTVSSFDSLKTHLLEFESEKIGVSPDSALTLFTGWYLHLQRTFYNYNKPEFFNSTKTKILFFSTTVSCYCTMEMCKRQLIDILTLKNQNIEKYSYMIVDSYWDYELQLKYEAFFAPSVLIFDGMNELLTLIEYDENMSKRLSDLLIKIERGEKI